MQDIDLSSRFMYTCIHGVYMWEVEPTLYWRVKKGTWTWVRAKLDEDGKPLPPELIESE